MSRIVPCPACGQMNRLSTDRQATKAHCAACKEELFPGRPIALTTASFDRQTRSADLPVLVDFWASWCGPCRAMAPVFDKTAGEYADRLRFAKVDTEAEQQVAARFQIRSIPTLVLIRGGREVARMSGALSHGDLKAWIAAQGIA